MLTKGLKRIVTEQFYTRHKIVKFCTKEIIKHVEISKNDIIIEPSAGNGAFVKSIKKMANHYRFYDILPKHKEVRKKNYLKLNENRFKKYDKIHIIGNPPFGRQSSLAFKFIKKSCEFCHTFSFILPKSFKKESMRNKIPLEFHLIYENDLPKNSFRIDGEKHDVPCVFQIWEKRDYKRLLPKKIKPIGFIFTKKNDNPDISFRRVGINAGRIDVKIKDKSIQSHYFLKLVNKNKIKELKKVKFTHNNTVGPKSISKQELIRKYNKILS